MLNTYSSLTRPTFLNSFWIILYSFLHPTIPHQYPFVIIALLCLIRSPPSIPAWNAVHLDVVHTLPPPAYAARLYSPHRMPAYDIVTRMFAPLFASLGLHPGS